MTVCTTKLLIFAKAPIAGKAKTRLIPALGAQQAAQLQEIFIQKTSDTCIKAGFDHVELWCTPDTEHPVFSKISAEKAVTLHKQADGDLGSKMAAAMKQVLPATQYAILIGTDCPAIDRDYLQQALAALKQGNDVVIGPAEDGGYVLIGMKSYCGEIFIDIDWSTSLVLEQTRERMVQHQIKWKELSVQTDIDRPEDLQTLEDPIYSQILAAIRQVT